jgi:hypothetical protein
MSNTKRHPFHFESRRQPLLPRPAFARRLGHYFAIVLVFIGVSLFVGMAGYHYLEDLPWIDAFVNAAMILSGMGPLAQLQTWSGKLFAGLYALYSGLAVLIAASILMAPIFHRWLHRFHLEEEGITD